MFCALLKYLESYYLLLIVRDYVRNLLKLLLGEVLKCLLEIYGK